jgi:SSS family solute:Na+ symporter
LPRSGTQPDRLDAYPFWAGSINAFFVGLAVFGADQELVQRLLTVETRRKSQTAIIATIAAALPMLCIYIFIGTLLFVFYAQNPAIAAPAQSKEVLSHFITNVLPFGLKGLLLAAIILASIDSPLSSLSSSFITDIYRPLVNRKASEKHYLIISRLAVVAFGLILAVIAFACGPVKNILWFAFKILSVTGGPLLGIFLLGILTKARSNMTNVFAMVFTAACMTILLILSEMKTISLGWTWLIVIGTLMTFALAWLLAFASRGSRQSY